MIKRLVRKTISDSAVNLFLHLPMAILANLRYGFPSRSLKVIGVTGSDGKTTTATIIYDILHQAGKKVALISTLSAKIGGKEVETGFHVTTPDPWLLQKLIKEIADKNFEYLVLEATSHGLAQYRLFGISIFVGVITNITHEHLDYHKSMDNYRRAKSKLFKQTKFAVLNKDDSSYPFLLDKAYRKSKIVTYGLSSDSEYNPVSFPFVTRLLGQYNQYNCLAAIATTKILGIEDKIIRNCLKIFKGVRGRMEEIKAGQGFRLIIDFAHTPNALENALITLRKQLRGKGRLISVFGCAGLRDIAKRPMMGEISAKVADVSVFTAEDPRTESLEMIIGQMVEGAMKTGATNMKDSNKTSKKGRYFVIVPDRREAIRYAINLARRDDIIGIFGKGHEQSMCFGTREYPWDDRKVAINLVKEYLALNRQ